METSLELRLGQNVLSISEFISGLKFTGCHRKQRRGNVNGKDSNSHYRNTQWHELKKYLRFRAIIPTSESREGFTDCLAALGRYILEGYLTSLNYAKKTAK